MPRTFYRAAAAGLLILMGFLAGGAAWRESVTVDEVAHVGAGLSYWQRFDLRLNREHPPLAKAIAAVPLVLRGTHADYSSNAWKQAHGIFPAYMLQWPFGDAVLGRWNNWKPVLMWARVPMLILTLLLGWCVWFYGAKIGGPWGGLLCLAMYVTTPAFLAFGPLVITDLPVTLFTLIALWQLGEIWAAPSRKNAWLFGLALAAALLSKFTALLIIPVVLLLFLQTRFWRSAAEPADKEGRKIWRSARWRCVWRAFGWTALIVYAVYFVLAWNQTDEVIDRVHIGVFRHLLMPLWGYLSGVALMLVTAGSRSTYLFGHILPHGVPYYFPVVFVLKSTLGFLLLLVVAAPGAMLARRRGIKVIPEEVRPQWRALMVGLFVFLAVCLVSQLDISIRHFMVPLILLIVMLAPLPRIIAAWPRARIWAAVASVCVASCFVSVLMAYPYFFPFVNSLSFGRPVYYLLNDSNVAWNEGLPAVGRFAEEHHLSELDLDWASLSDPALVVPQARIWDCQAPTEHDAGQWVAVEAVSILENHDCGYLQQYPHEALAGGGYYVFKLPTPIPAAGAPGGPPLAAQRRIMWGMPFDLRAWAVDIERHPENLPAAMQAMLARFEQQQKAAARKK